MASKAYRLGKIALAAARKVMTSLPPPGTVITPEALRDFMDQQQQEQQNLGQALGPSLAQLKAHEEWKQQQYQQALQQQGTIDPRLFNPAVAAPQFPSLDSIQKRIVQTKEQIKQATALLETLQSIHSVLEKHPDLERLVTTMARLGQL